MKYFCFRFDVDTHVCMARGVPNLIDAADSLDARFTFFVNMGRAFDRGITIRKMLSRGVNKGPAIPKLSVRAKMGLLNSVIALSLNPFVGRAHPGYIRTAVEAGHEVGLHGGRNHAQWEQGADEWTTEKVREEVAVGMRLLEECSGVAPSSFSSPAWKTPKGLGRILSSMGFRVLADARDRDADGVLQIFDGSMTSVPTNILGRPGGVGYLENLRVRGFSTAEIIGDFQKQLAAKRNIAVVYDHPFYAGIHELPLVKEMVSVAADNGFKIATIRDIAMAFRGKDARGAQDKVE